MLFRIAAVVIRVAEPRTKIPWSAVEPEGMVMVLFAITTLSPEWIWKQWCQQFEISFPEAVPVALSLYHTTP
jgi:hypothetical protein